MPAWPFTNPARLPSGDILCAITHPVWGVVPFSASAFDKDENGRDTYKAIIAHGPVPDYVAPVVSTGTAAPIVKS